MQTGPGAHSASNSLRTGSSFPGGKTTGVWGSLLTTI